MSLIDKVRKMFGGGELPDEVSPLYRGAKNEREALILLKEARRRDVTVSRSELVGVVPRAALAGRSPESVGLPDVPPDLYLDTYLRRGA